MRQAALGIDPPALTFQEGAGGVHVDLRRLVAGRLVASASSGGGKGWFGRYLAEQTAAEIPQLILDWEGEYPSLKSVHPYVWVGEALDGADLPVSAAGARAQCRRLMAAGASVVLDLSPLDVDARREVAGLWLDELMSRAIARHPRLVIVDEAHELAPQGGDVASSVPLKRLVSQGRKRGYGAVLLTQRLSRLSKDAAESANRMIGRTILDVDVRRAAEELGMDRARSQELKRLRPGQWYAFGPAIQDGEGVVLCRAGETRSAFADGTLAKMGVPTPAAIAEALKGLDAAADGPADDAGREELLEEIDRLREQLKAAKEGNVSEPADIARAVSAATSPLQERISSLEVDLARCRHHAAAIFLGLGEIPPETIEKVNTEAVQTSAGTEGPAIGSYELRILDALAKGELSRDDLASKVGATSRKSSKFRSAVGALRAAGLVDFPRDMWVRLAEGKP